MFRKEPEQETKYYSVQQQSQQYNRPQDSYRSTFSIERTSFKDPYQSAPMLQPKQSYENIRPASQDKSQPQQHPTQVQRPYSTSYDRRQQDNIRNSFKQSQPLKNSVFVQPQQYATLSMQLQRQNQQYYQNNFFSQKENIEVNQKGVEKNQPNKIDRITNSFMDSDKINQSTKIIKKPDQENIARKTETEGQESSKSTKQQDYQEYKKLQDKLQYLENKILNIKSHIDSNNQQLSKQKSLQQKEMRPKGLTAKFFSNKLSDSKKKGDVQFLSKNKINQENREIKSKSPFEEEQDSNKQRIQKQPSYSRLINKQEPSTPQAQSANSTLSKFVTQVKPQQTYLTNNNQETSKKILKKNDLNSPSPQQLQNSIKNMLIKPESAKSSNSQQKILVRKGSSNDLQRNSSFTSLQSKQPMNQEVIQNGSFLYYISSVIKCFMSNEQNKGIEQTKEHFLQSIQAVQYCKQMKDTLPSVIDEKKVYIPRKDFYQNKKTIIFDLDETLIHCNESVQIPGDVILPIRFPTGEIIEASVNIRPFAQQILQTLSRHFEIIVFTASHACYANVVLDYLDPQKQWISYRLFRESCVQTEEGAYIKDLRVIANRSLSDMLLVDNAIYSFGLQLQNGVPILNYYDNKQDQELLYLQNYLMQFRNLKDMKEANNKFLKLSRFSEFNDPIQLLSTIFKEQIPN